MDFFTWAIYWRLTNWKLHVSSTCEAVTNISLACTSLNFVQIELCKLRNSSCIKCLALSNIDTSCLSCSFDHFRLPKFNVNSSLLSVELVLAVLLLGTWSITGWFVKRNLDALCKQTALFVRLLLSKYCKNFSVVSPLCSINEIVGQCNGNYGYNWRL